MKEGRKTSRTLHQRIARLGAVAALAAASLIATAVPASAEPTGDGVTAPSHDSSLAVIPLCKGPVAVGDWLDKNFADHGRDSRAFIATNSAALQALARGESNPLTAPALFAGIAVQIPTYAYNDAMFHLPPTALSVATGCGFIGTTGVNPFNILR